MPRTLRRLSATVAAIALGLGGVTLGAAPAQAAEFPAPNMWSLPSSVTWDDRLTFDLSFEELRSSVPDASGFSVTYTDVSWRRVSDDALLGTGFAFVIPQTMIGQQIYGVVKVLIYGGNHDGDYMIFTSTATGAVKDKVFEQPTLTVAGEAIAGNTLTVAGSGWGATPTSYDWEWRRVSGNTLVGSGTGTSVGGYTVTSEDVAAASVFYAIVTAHRSGYPDATWATSFSQTAHLGSFANVTAVPTVSGTGHLGTSYTASYDTAGIAPAPTTVTIQWRTTDGTLIGTGSSFTPTNALLGQPLYATALLERADYSPYTTLGSTYSATVALGSFSNVGVPTVSGTGRLGTSFTVSLDTSETTPEPTSISYRWHTTDGTVVGTGASFTPDNSLLGQPLYATAVLTRADYSDYSTLGSSYTATVTLAEFTPGAAPVITGRNALGGTLTASLDTSAWAPAPSSLSYQWYLEDGTAITDATSTTLAMTSALVGEVVYVTVTARKADHQDYVISSAPTGRIASPLVATDKKTVSAGGTVLVEAWGLLLGEEYTVELHSTPVVLGTATSDAAGTLSQSFSIPAGTAAGDHSIVLLRDGVVVATSEIRVVTVTSDTTTDTADDTIAAAGADLGALPIGVGLLMLGAAALGLRRRSPQTIS